MSIPNLGGYVQALPASYGVRPPSALLNSLLAYYSFSSLLVDSTGRGNTLTNVNGVTQGIGIINQAAVFSAGSSQELTAVNNTDVSPSGSFTVALWFYPTTNARRTLIACMEGPFGGPDWGKGFHLDDRGAYVGGFGGNVRFSVLPGANLDSGGIVTSPDNGTSRNAWNLAIFSWDQTNRVMRVRANNGTAITNSNNPNGYSRATSASLEIGYGPDGWGSVYYTGSIDEVGIWNRVLTPTEETYLWNGGVGITYPFTGIP